MIKPTLLILATGLAGVIAAAATAQGHQTPGTTPLETPKAIVDRTCQSCHDLGTLSQRPHAAGEWPAIIQRMRSNGADLTDAEAKQVQDYLAATLSAKP